MREHASMHQTITWYNVVWSTRDMGQCSAGADMTVTIISLLEGYPSLLAGKSFY